VEVGVPLEVGVGVGVSVGVPVGVSVGVPVDVEVSTDSIPSLMAGLMNSSTFSATNPISIETMKASFGFSISISVLII
jgi:hypothetical protein